MDTALFVDSVIVGGDPQLMLTKALHELERPSGRSGLVTMCCGGGLGTGTIIERL
jgi:acetyl-CoA C-acetyltransferase